MAIEFFLNRKEYMVFGFPKNVLENSHFISVMEKFDAKIQTETIEKCGENLVTFRMSLKQDNEERVKKWILESTPNLK